MDLKVLWNKFLETVKQEVSSISYNTWFAETELHDMNNGKARVIVPMPIHKKHLSDSYKEMATRIFNEITGSNFEFEFLLKDEIDDDNSSNVQKRTTNRGGRSPIQ